MTNLNFVNGGSIMPNFKRTQFCTHNQSHNLPSRYFGQGLIQLKKWKDRLFTPTTIQIWVNGKLKKGSINMCFQNSKTFLYIFECFQEFLFFTCPDQTFFYLRVDTWIWRAVATTYLKQLLFDAYTSIIIGLLERIFTSSLRITQECERMHIFNRSKWVIFSSLKSSSHISSRQKWQHYCLKHM